MRVLAFTLHPLVRLACREAALLPHVKDMGATSAQECLCTVLLMCFEHAPNGGRGANACGRKVTPASYVLT
jgi:hypothetical protein